MLFIPLALVLFVAGALSLWLITWVAASLIHMRGPKPDPQPAVKKKGTPAPAVAAAKEVSQSDRNVMWAGIAKRLLELDLKVVDAETNPSVYLSHPLIRDRQVPATSEFYDKWLEAAGLVRDRSVPSDNLTVYSANRAVSLAESAWDKAVAHAKNVGIPELTDAQRKQVATARNLLALAADDSATLPERASALENAKDLIQELLPDMRVTIEETFGTFRLPLETALRAEIQAV